MTHFEPPDIPTNDVLSAVYPQTWDAGTVALEASFNRVVPVQYVAVNQRVGGIELPGVPYDYGWHAPQLASPYANTMFQDAVASPGIPWQSSTYSREVIQAAHPIPTYAKTGMPHHSLRAPAINEGY